MTPYEKILFDPFNLSILKKTGRTTSSDYIGVDKSSLITYFMAKMYRHKC